MKTNHKYISEEISKLFILMCKATFLIFFLPVSITQADNVISSGTNIRINSGTFITMAQNIVVEKGGNLTIEGTLILKNSLIDQNTFDDLGTGTIEFSGTLPQSLSGQNIFGSLVVKNPSGIDLMGNTFLNTRLGLQIGTIRLGPNNLTLGSMAVVTGTPSVSSMVLATGTGELRKSYSGISSFTYPVGDDLGIAEYSPVTLSFSGGTFAADNYVGVKLTNSAYPGLSGNVLNRYWSLTQNGIADPQYDAAFQYVTSDINGNENNLSCAMVEPAPIVSYNAANTSIHELTASGLRAFGVFTGITSTIIQNISLNIGWNIISAYVIPNNLDLKDIFQSVIDAGKLKKVMDESGKTIENFGALGGWKNSIGNLNLSKGYKINVTTASSIPLEGLPVVLPYSIALNAGWNIISYPSATSQDGKVLFQELIDAGKLKKAMDESGKTIENFGALGGWKNSIGNFLPGKGYRVNVLSNCTLTIPASATKAAAIVPEVLASTHFTKVFTGNGTDHVTIHLVNLHASGLKAGDEIGIFDGILCVGSAMIGTEQLIAGSISMPASANDELGQAPNGFTSGNPIALKLFRDNKEYLLKTETLLNSQTSFAKGESMIAQVNFDPTTTQVDEFASQTTVRCYPNPFNEQITIEIKSANKEKLEVNIYDRNGKLVRKLYNGQINNIRTLIWDGCSEGSARVVQGTYLINTNGKIEKVVLMD